jgi:hypothetical protein
MSRKPLKNNQRQAKRKVVNIACPTGGLNLRDNIANMSPNDAVIMDNFIPQETYIEQRRGFTEVYKIEDNKPGESIISYEVAAKHEILFSAAGKIYKFSLNAQSPTFLKGDFFGNNWVSVLYKQNLFLVNGQDKPQIYDGTEIKDAAFTVPAGQTLDLRALYLTTLFKNRLFFAEKDSLNVWYAKEAGNIAGDLLKLDLNQIASKGGKVAAIANWTQQGGQGQDNLFIVITTQGECFVYDGNDPSSIDAWALRGIYQIPRVVGINNNTTLAGNVIIITESGYYPLSKVLSDAFANKTVAFSDKINGEFKNLRPSFDLPNWQINYISSQDLMIVNVPLPAQESIQHVMNCTTGSWCRFTGINMNCFTQLGNEIYFCGSDIDENKEEYNGIFKLLDGESDNGKPIQSYCQSAFCDFGFGQLKRWELLKIVYMCKTKLNYQISFGIDYKLPNLAEIFNNQIDDSKWDVSQWDVSPWAQEDDVFENTTILHGVPGLKGSIGLKLANSTVLNATFKWLTSTISFETESE